MGIGTLLSLAAKSLLNRKGSALLTLIAIALAVGLFLAVEKTRTGVRTGFENTISDTDLIVGARTAPVSLLLASVFRIGNVTANIPHEEVDALRARDDIAWVAPLSLGDNHRGYRVMGVDAAYYEHYRYADSQPLRIAAGTGTDDLFDAVLGAEVARELGYSLGDEMEFTHGLGEEGISDHEHREFHVAGILAPTGTPVDRTVHVSLEAITAIHVGWESGSYNPLADNISNDQLREFDLHAREVSAVLVGLKAKGSILRTKREIDTKPGSALVAIIPGLTLSELWDVTATAERALLAVSVFVIVVGLVSILTSILTSLNERRREMSILRAVGARPGDIGLLLVLEAGLLAGLGALLGAVIVNLGLLLAGPSIAARTGVTLQGAGFGALELASIAIVTLAAMGLALIPAFLALRRSLADGLSVRI